MEEFNSTELIILCFTPLGIITTLFIVKLAIIAYVNIKFNIKGKAK